MARANALRAGVDRSRRDVPPVEGGASPPRRTSASSGGPGRRPGPAGRSSSVGDLRQPSGNRVSFVEGFVADDCDDRSEDGGGGCLDRSPAPVPRGQASPTRGDPTPCGSHGRELTPPEGGEEAEGGNSLGGPSPRHPGAARRRRGGEYTARESKAGAVPASDPGGPALVLSRRDGGEGPHGRSISFHAAA